MAPMKDVEGESNLELQFHEMKTSSPRPCIFYQAFWFPEKKTVSSSIEMQTSKENVKKDQQIYDEDKLSSYMDRYYLRCRGVHRVPSVMFHIDSWKVKINEDTKKNISEDTKTGQTDVGPIGKQNDASKSSSTDKVQHTEKKTNGDESTFPLGKDGMALGDINTAPQLELKRDGAVCITDTQCAQTLQKDWVSSRRGNLTQIDQSISQMKGTSNKKVPEKTFNKSTGKRKGKVSAEKQQGKKSYDKFVTDISLACDDDVKDKSVKELVKLTEKQYVEILRKRKELNAVDTVASFVETFGENGKYNMFILTEYLYKSYLQVAAKKKNQSFITSVNGDHDVLVLWKEVGIIFFQVKSNLKKHAPITIAGDISHALEQLLSDKFAFWQSNRDLSFISKIPIYCFIAEPLLEDSRLGDFNICSNHKSLILTKSAFESQESFHSWVHRNITINSNCPPFEEDEYRLLAARYVGNLSIRNLPNAIKTAGELLQRVYLNPSQLQLAQNKNKLQILAGNYGTGKTLVLCFHANDILKSNPGAFVHCITCSDISREGLLSRPECPLLLPDQMNNLLKQTSKESRLQSESFGQVYRKVYGDQNIPRVLFITARVFYETLSKLIASNENSKKEQHILLDEVPFVIFENKDDSSKYLEELLKYLSENSNIWISIASHTYKVDVHKNENPAESLARQIPTQFHFSYLKYAMRVSQRQFDMIQEIENFTEDGHHAFSEIGHVIKGPMPRLYALSSCKCNLQSPTKESRYKTCLPCDCSSRRLSDVFKTVFKFVENNFRKDIVVLIEYGVEGPFYNKMCEIVDIALQRENTNWVLAFKSKRGSPEVKSSSTEQMITVADGRTFRGCENRIVIVVDPFYMCQWFKTEGHVGVPTMVLTRCLSQYIHITWPKEECNEICMQALEEYDRAIKNSRGAKLWQDAMTEFVRQARNTALNTHFMLLERLVDKRLIRDCRGEISEDSEL